MMLPSMQRRRQGERALLSTTTLPSTQAHPQHAARHVAQRRYARDIARLAVRSLYAELSLYPKPGLVSLVDNGSHRDMNAATFMRSLFALRHYFYSICAAGMDDAPFSQLKQLGMAAEARMMLATGGINTHRGAIFSLGLLCAAAGRAHAQAMPLSAPTLRAVLLISWGEALAAHTSASAAVDARGNAAVNAAADTSVHAAANAAANATVNASASHGLRAAALYAASGAREEGALGLPSVFEIGLPAMQATLARGGSMYHARVDALFALMAHVSDTNVLHRGGARGAQIVRDEARRFIALGGTARPGWRDGAVASHRLFVRHRLSPGGAADLLAATALVLAMLTRGRP